MDSIRCSTCALVNFTTASACKRCGNPLGPIEAEGIQSQLAESDSRWSQSNYSPSPSISSSYPQAYDAYSYAKHGGRKGKTIAIILVSLFCLVAAVGLPWYLKSSKSELANISWRPFTSNNGDFTILMPQEPQLKRSSQSTPQGLISADMYYLQTEGKTALGVGSITYPTTQIAPDLMFDRAFESMTGRTGAIVLTRKNIMLDGYQGVEWEIKPPVAANLPNDRGLVRLYWAAPTFYIVMIGGPDSPEAAGVRTKYLDSFKILARS